jgi:hypothetical protein
MNCSATVASMTAGLAGAIAFAAFAARAEATDELDDAAARLQYAFYTDDARSIEEVLGLIDGFEVEAGLAPVKSYQLAYGHWKLAQIYSAPADKVPPNAKVLAAKSAQACVRHAQAAVAADARMAEAYAILAVCDTFSVSRASPPACARNKSLRWAVELAPDNPRVKLIEALCSTMKTSDPAVIQKWRSVVAHFEAAPPSRPGKPDWGHAEALTLLGEFYLERGDPVAARDVLERALVLAPDYRQAQKLLQTAASRPR